MKRSINDNYCPQILKTLINYGKEIRFNELYKLLNALGLTLSKPTLYDHLKHLMEVDIVTREEKGFQHVTYRINDKILEWSPTLYKQLEEKYTKYFKESIEDFFSLSIEDQVTEAMRKSCWMFLERLRILIDPNYEFEKGFALLLIADPKYRFEENWIRARSWEDTQYQKLVHNKITEIIEDITEKREQNEPF